MTDTTETPRTEHEVEGPMEENASDYADLPTLPENYPEEEDLGDYADSSPLTPVVGGIYLSTNTVGDFLPYVDPDNRLVVVVSVKHFGTLTMVRVETVDRQPLGVMDARCLRYTEGA